jgi:hypothetical protein
VPIWGLFKMWPIWCPYNEVNTVRMVQTEKQYCCSFIPIMRIIF